MLEGIDLYNKYRLTPLLIRTLSDSNRSNIVLILSKYHNIISRLSALMQTTWNETSYVETFCWCFIMIVIK